jgi:hypothetical protein
MQPEKQARLKESRNKIKALTPEQRTAMLAERGIIGTIEGRTLSTYNTLMCYFQSYGQAIPTIVGGFKQWKKAGRQVTKGQHGYSILFPVGEKNEEGDIISTEHFYCGTVFDITQTEAIEETAPASVPVAAGTVA